MTTETVIKVNQDIVETIANFKSGTKTLSSDPIVRFYKVIFEKR